MYTARRILPLALAAAGAAVALAVLAPAALAARRVAVTFSCGAVTFSYSGFPNASGNTVKEKVKADGIAQANEAFSFDGPAATDTIPLTLTAGRHKIIAEAHWKTNGVVGESGHHREEVPCGGTTPGFTIQKLQMIEGSGKNFEKLELTGRSGQTVAYEIIVSNTGGSPLLLSAFSDPNCDPGTLTGGPGEAALQPGKQTTWTCTRLLTSAGRYENVATVEATPVEGTSLGVKGSEPVYVKVPPEPGLKLQKLQALADSGAAFSEAQLAAYVGQTVEYRIIATNTGNVPLELEEFVDLGCDEGTIVGGPGRTPLAPGASSTYTCSYKITELGEKDRHTNTATVVGASTVAGVAPLPVASDTVIVTTAEAPIVPPANQNQNQNQPDPGSGNATGSGTPGSSGTSSSGTSSPSGSGGVLSSKHAKRHAKLAHRTSARRAPHFTG